MRIKVEPGLALKKEKKEEAARKEEEKASDSREDLVTPEPGVEADTDTSVTAESTVEITPLGKDDAAEEMEEADETSGVVGEMFSQLVGEVEKINEAVKDKTKESEAKETEAGEGEANQDETKEGEAKNAEDTNQDKEDDEKDKDDVEEGGDETRQGNATEDMENEVEGKSVGPQVSLPPGISISRSPTKDPKEDEVGEPEKKTNGDIEAGSEDTKDDEAGPSKQSDDWVPDDALEEDLDGEDEYYETNGTGEEEGATEGVDAGDDFGGYDPLKLVQMSESDLNELDFEMDDDMEGITTEDHEIFDENSEGVEGAEELPNDSEDNGEKKEGEDEDSAGLSENVHTDYDMDFTDADGVSLDQEEDHGTGEPPLEENLQPSEGEAAEDTLDDSKEDTVNDDAFDMEVPKSGADRSYNCDDNLNEDCDDDMGPDMEPDCINDDVETAEGAEVSEHAADMLSEDFSSDQAEAATEETEASAAAREEAESAAETVDGEEESGGEPGDSCDNSA